MTVAEWSTIASLATALGTLILAVATFSAVRSSNLMAKVAQQQLLIQLRPVLAPSRREDPALKVNFGDMKWVQILGGGAVGEVGAGDGSMGSNTPVVYLAIALRNAGNGIAVLQGWRFFPEAHRDTGHAPLEEFQRQTRDLYIPVGDVGFWQGRSATPRRRATSRHGRPSRLANRGRSSCFTPIMRAASGPSAASWRCRWTTRSRSSRAATRDRPGRPNRAGSPPRAGTGASIARTGVSRTKPVGPGRGYPRRGWR